MKTQSIEHTLSLSEEIVRDAWRTFVGSSPALISVPAFLSWAGHEQPQVLRLVNETALVKIASKLYEAERKP